MLLNKNIFLNYEDYHKIIIKVIIATGKNELLFIEYCLSGTPLSTVFTIIQSRSVCCFCTTQNSLGVLEKYKCQNSNGCCVICIICPIGERDHFLEVVGNTVKNACFLKY